MGEHRERPFADGDSITFLVARNFKKPWEQNSFEGISDFSVVDTHTKVVLSKSAPAVHLLRVADPEARTLGLELAAFSHEPARLAWSFVSDGGITKSGMLVRNHDGKNLAGLWDFAVTERAMAQPPAAYQGKIMAPFPIESALSGIKRSLARHEKLWYRLAVEVPWGTDWLKGQNARLMLRFGGVSGTADVFVNGKMRGSHQGSDDGFSFDMTDLITAKDKHTLEIVVAATPADTSPGIQATGICKPAWIEVVRTSHIEALTFVPDVDASIVRVEFAPDGTIHPADPRLQ